MSRLLRMSRDGSEIRGRIRRRMRPDAGGGTATLEIGNRTYLGCSLSLMNCIAACTMVIKVRLRELWETSAGSR